MRLAIYACFLNEEANVTRWLDAIQPELLAGDSITVVDTGSTDESWHKFFQRSILPHRVSIKPWRFDIARNTALALTDPAADFVWMLDRDEIPQPGGRQAIEDAWGQASHKGNRFRYRLLWSHQPDGSGGYVFYADKMFPGMVGIGAA